VRKNALATATILLALMMASTTRAGTVNETFATNPYTSRWCTKVQDTVWLSVLQQLQGMNTATCGSNPCCAGCPGAPSQCARINAC
jgi:hypothetical protein